MSRENVEENLRADSVAALQDIYSDLVNISIFYIHHHIHIHVHILYTYIIHTPGQYILFLYIPHHHISIISIIYLFGPGQYIHLLYFYIYPPTPPGQYIHFFPPAPSSSLRYRGQDITYSNFCSDGAFCLRTGRVSIK